ncbi:hypothetical protein [Acrocarpospora sp. B8E8]|uniref:hypothetical protein n=1 Tax=Acrocarpospora sp. B8E8 TaxID=3153572 RepID=UPI00325D5585
MIAVENLRIGDELTLPDRAVKITRLVPETTEATVAYGAREVFSGSWSQTFDVGQKVNAIPRKLAAQVGEVSSTLTPQEILRYAHLALDGSPSMGLLDAIHTVCPRDERGQALAHEAMHLLYAHIYRHPCVGNVARALARWESIRTPDEVLMVLARAADDQAAVRVLEAHDAEMAAIEGPESAPEGGARDDH